MKTWTQIAIAAGAVLALFGVSLAYSRLQGADWLAALEIAELERIPTLDQE